VHQVTFNRHVVREVRGFKLTQLKSIQHAIMIELISYFCKLTCLQKCDETHRSFYL